MEKSGSEIIQLFDHGYFKYEEAYIMVIKGITKHIKHHKDILMKMAKGLLSQINGLTFNRNKIVLNYHRSLALCLFAMSDGSIPCMNLHNVSGWLDLSQEELI